MGSQGIAGNKALPNEWIHLLTLRCFNLQNGCPTTNLVKLLLQLIVGVFYGLVCFVHQLELVQRELELDLQFLVWAGRGGLESR